MGLLASAAALVLAGALHRARAGGTCPGKAYQQGQGRVVLELAGTEYQVVSHEDLQGCLQQLTVPADIAYHTIMHLEHGIGDVYSYTQLAKNSQASDQRVTSGCNLQVHESEVDLQGGLDDLKRYLVAEAAAGGARSTPADFEALRTCGANFPAQDFHRRLSELFRTLFDAHTAYLSPIAQLAPAYIFGEWGNMLQFRLTRSAQAQATVLQVKRRTSGAWEAVETVVAGGRTFAPLEWLQEWADKGVGQYRSRGARLNSLYSSLSVGVFETEPLHSDVVLQVAGGRPLDAPLRALMLNEDAEAMQVVINSNPRWTAVREWLDAHLNLQGPRQAAAMEQALARARAEAVLRRPPLLAPRDVSRALERLLAAAAEPRAREAGPGRGPAPGLRADAREPVVEGRRLAVSGVGTIGVVFADPATRSEIAAEAYHVSDAVVFKVNTFAPSSFGIELLVKLVRLYRQTVDAGWRHGRLILDLSDNGGGVVEYANLLTYLISPQHHTPEALCSQYRVAVSEFWSKWIESFGGRWNMLLKQAEQLGAEDIRARLIRLRSILRLQSEIGAVPPLRTDVVESLTHDAETLDHESLKQTWKRMLSQKDSLLVPFQGLGRPTFQSLTGENTESGWFPFTGDVKDPQTESAFHPPAEPFLHTEEHKWGPESASYSQRYLFACDLAFQPDVANVLHLRESKWQWKEVAVLTNGLCGSACSLIATKLQFAEGATMFTYGGVPHDGGPAQEPMDHSAFAGGNVEQYKDFWPNVLYAALVGDILWGPDTPIGKLLREPGARQHHWANSLLLPLPSPAVTTFNYNMMHIKELGPDALPREWYNIPAHKNYDVWLAGGTEEGNNGQAALYKQVSSEDWGALREAKAAEYGCAESPPPWNGTKSPDRDFPDYDEPPVVLALLMLGLLLVCCCCCCCGCLVAGGWGLYHWQSQRRSARAAVQPGAARQAQHQPGVEMPALPVAPGSAAAAAQAGG